MASNKASKGGGAKPPQTTVPLIPSGIHSSKKSPSHQNLRHHENGRGKIKQRGLPPSFYELVSCVAGGRSCLEAQVHGLHSDSHCCSGAHVCEHQTAKQMLPWTTVPSITSSIHLGFGKSTAGFITAGITGASQCLCPVPHSTFSCLISFYPHNDLMG